MPPNPMYSHMYNSRRGIAPTFEPASRQHHQHMNGRTSNTDVVVHQGEIDPSTTLSRARPSTGYIHDDRNIGGLRMQHAQNINTTDHNIIANNDTNRNNNRQVNNYNNINNNGTTNLVIKTSRNRNSMDKGKHNKHDDIDESSLSLRQKKRMSRKEREREKWKRKV